MTTRRRGLVNSPFNNSPVVALLADYQAEDEVLSVDEANPIEAAVPQAQVAETVVPPAIASRAPKSKLQRGRAIGTRINPYARKDGVQTVKVAFSASADFEARLRLFIAGLPATITRNEWMEQALARAMDREERRK
jgi:hypothetical protein